VIDYIDRLSKMKEEVANMGLDPTVRHRAEDGVLSIGGDEGIIIGCTDEAAYQVRGGGERGGGGGENAGAAGAAHEVEGTHAVDELVPKSLKGGSVLDDFSCMLNQVRSYPLLCTFSYI
jgi:hypothetical protein